MARHSYHSRKSGSSKSSSSKKTHSFKERGYSKDSKPSTSKRSSGPKIVSKKTGQEVKREQQKKAAQTARKIEGTHSYHERKASGVLDVKPATPKVTTKPVAPAPAKKAEIKKPVSRIPTPAPKTRAEQAARRLDIDPRLAKHFTEYEVSTIMGAQSMTIKSDKARDMYKGMLEKRAKGGKPRVITKEQIAAMDRQAKREQELIRKRNLQEYKPLLDKDGKEIPRFGAVIKDGKFTGTTALKGKGVKGVISGKYYLSKAEHAKAQKINRAATKQITAKTNPLEKRRILDARQQIMKSLPGKDATQALRYFSSVDRAIPISAMIPTAQQTARVTQKLINAGVSVLSGTKYTEAQKRAIVETKLRRKPIKQDFKADWGRLDKKLSTGLNLPTESEIADHRDRTFGKIPGFTKWQADFAKKMDTPKYFHGVNISVSKGFKDFSFNEYNRLRNKPATYGAELAAMFIGGAVLGAVTKGGTIITKAGLAKAATRSTRPMVKAGLLKGVKHLDTMVAAGFITPMVAEGIVASWEDKFKLGKGLLIGGAGFAKGTKRAAKATERISSKLESDITKGMAETGKIITETTARPLKIEPPEIKQMPKVKPPKPAKFKPKGAKPKKPVTKKPAVKETVRPKAEPKKPVKRTYEMKEADRISREMSNKLLGDKKATAELLKPPQTKYKRPKVPSGKFTRPREKRYLLGEQGRAAKELKSYSDKHNLGIKIVELRAPTTLGKEGRLLRYEARAPDGTVISKVVGAEQINWGKYRSSLMKKKAAPSAKGGRPTFVVEPARRWRLSEQIKMVKKLEEYAVKNKLDIKIVEIHRTKKDGTLGAVSGYQAHTRDGTVLSKKIGVQKMNWDLYKTRPGPKAKVASIDHFVEYKGKLFEVPTALKGAKRQLFLKRAYEGKPLDVPVKEYERGEISRRKLKERAQPSPRAPGKPSGDFLAKKERKNKGRTTVIEIHKAVKALEKYSDKKRLGIKITDVMGKYEARGPDGKILSKNVGIEKIDWTKYKPKEKPKAAPVLDTKTKFVKHKGLEIEVPKSLEGKKLNRYLNKRVEEINSEKVETNRALKQFKDFVTNEEAQLLRGKTKNQKVYREVAPKVREVRAQARRVKPDTNFSIRKGKTYINGVEIQPETYRYMRKFRGNPYKQLRNSDIVALKRALRFKLRVINDVKKRIKIRAFINMMPMRYMNSALLSIGVVGLAIEATESIEFGILEAEAIERDVAESVMSDIESKTGIITRTITGLAVPVDIMTREEEKLVAPVKYKPVPKPPKKRPPRKPPVRPPKPKEAPPKERPPKRPPPKPRPRKPKPEEMPPVIPPLPRRRRKPKKPLTKKEKITIDEMSRTITNKLGDINSILG